ncbi:bud neck involved protein [Conoideocrella luteorostrata]|uniref:Bud neck involved protein n=1 Tax=Conoideocrella luteorostrata TaxID=1105319 RepID=A0AAJ0G179_9HYPO|nr:bud neck involved protein [Conoideocrella luteorostrata]
MAALVQTYPQQTSTTTMLQTRSSSNGAMMPNSQSHGNHQYNMGSSQAPRSAYNPNGSAGYRGSSGSAPSFAFSSTPNLSQTLSWQQYGAYRTSSSPAVPSSHTYDVGQNYRPVMQNNAPGFPNSFGAGYGGSRDDSALTPGRNIAPSARPHSYLSVGTQPSFSTSTKQSVPDRYRRTATVQPSHHARSQSSTLQPSPSMAPPSQAYQASRRYSASNLTGSQGLSSVSSMDDLQHYKRALQEDTIRMRRRSMHSIETSDHSSSRPISRDGADPKQPRLAKPNSHSRNGSSESVSSSRSSHSRPSSATNRNASVAAGTPYSPANEETSLKNDQQRMLSIPPRGSSSDVVKRAHSPSPLSKPATAVNDPNDDSTSHAGATANLESPAAKHLAALNQKGGKGKSKTSRLRRAFSFGSAAEFRKAAEEAEKAEPSKLHKDPSPEEAYDAEQDRIAQAQEAGGIGNSIYGGRFFGSTDNLSISSTASSASIMIRKMGRGMKKSTRSIVGLFRPKSVVGVPAAEPLAPETSQAEVSMVTVEAETQRVNVTPDPHAVNGGTGFPRLERNSVDAAQVSDSGIERLGGSAADQSTARKSIVGGESERAEVLAAVRKGILKRSGSPSVRPVEGLASPDLVLPNIPAIADSPVSSAPSTPSDESHGHKRTGSIAIGSEDYFMSALRLRQDSQSGTPSAKRNATFSPRLIFYDTWPPQEYDRRGEIATCNRLTPLLAQQIKEELNSFKMEMEVHENSKIYTHFF